MLSLLLRSPNIEGLARIASLSREKDLLFTRHQIRFITNIYKRGNILCLSCIYCVHCPPKTTLGLSVGVAFAGGVIVTGWLNLLRSTIESRATVALDGKVFLPLALGVLRELKSASALTFSSVR